MSTLTASILTFILGVTLTYLGIMVYYHNFDRCDCSGWENNYIECNRELGSYRIGFFECIDCSDVLKAQLEYTLNASRFYYASWIELAEAQEMIELGLNHD